jgi:hypothetical protein
METFSATEAVMNDLATHSNAKAAWMIGIMIMIVLVIGIAGWIYR